MAERKLNLEDLPSNSFSSQAPDEPEPITAVTTGNVKKGRKRRVASDIRNATAGLYDEILLPAFKGIISDFVANALDMLLFGGQNGYRGTNRYGGSQRSYHNMYQQRQKPPQRGRMVSGSPRSVMEEEIYFMRRPDAEAVLAQMFERVAKYGWVTVGDMYTLSGATAHHTTERYGWSNISQANVLKTPSGWIIDLPEPEYDR